MLHRRANIPLATLVVGLAVAVAASGLSADAAAQTRHGDTIMFDRPPTERELQALFGEEDRPKPRTRGLTRKPVLGGSATEDRGEPSRPPAGQTFAGQASADHQVATSRPGTLSGTKLGFNLRFRNDSAEILPAHLPYLDQIGKLLSQERQIRMAILGHADASGSATYNQRLSQRRARAIWNYLVQSWQVSPGQLTAIGFGESQPLAGLPPHDPKNRRVEFVRQ
jgi:outer membrane protein OmpA-like peptidoglycan-associated protein